MNSKELDDFVCQQARRLQGIGYHVSCNLRDWMGVPAWQITIHMKTHCAGCMLTQQLFDVGEARNMIASIEQQLRYRLQARA